MPRRVRLVVAGLLLLAVVAVTLTARVSGGGRTEPRFSETRDVGIDHDAVARAYGAYVSNVGQQISQAGLDRQYQALARQQFGDALTTARVTWTEVDSVPSARALCERSEALGYGVTSVGNGTDLVYLVTSAPDLTALPRGAGTFCGLKP